MRKNTIDNVIKDLLVEAELCKSRYGKNFYFNYENTTLEVTYLWNGKKYEFGYEYEEEDE